LRAFVRQQAQSMLAVDFFTVDVTRNGRASGRCALIGDGDDAR
jgi:hypothetical protein